jgi:hypothetical protein
LARLLHWEAITSLGESAAETAVLLRAGVSNVESSHFIDRTGQRVMLCSAPALPPDLVFADRMTALASHALTGLWQAIEPSLAAGETAAAPTILIALPERFAATGTSFDLTDSGKAFVAALRTHLPSPLARADIEAFPFGRAAGALAMKRAAQLVRHDRVVIWGGVDSLHDWSVLQALEAADRLLTLDNVDGVRPGEAAAFAALGPVDAAAGVMVLSLGVGREMRPVGSDEPCMSDGLSKALESAVQPLRAAGARSNCWLLDTTHEAYGTHEVQNIIARFGDVIGTQTDMQMPLKELGDVGAAAIPLLAVLGAQAWRCGHANDDTAVIAGGSDGGARGALLMASDGSMRGAA